MATDADRLFILLDPQTRRVIDLCYGPAADGACPRYVAGQQLPCEGYKVIPLRRTSANGLPFRVGRCDSARCPLAWLDSGENGAVEGLVNLPEPGATSPLPPPGASNFGEGSIRPAL